MPLRISCFGPVRRRASFREGRPGPVPPMPGFGSCAPLRAGLCIRDGLSQGGRPVCRSPWELGWGAPRGGGLLYLGPSVCLPWVGTKAGLVGVAQFMEGVASILLKFVSACRPRVWSAGRPCVLVRVRLPVVITVGAGGWRRGGVCRTGLAASPARLPWLSGGGDLPWTLGG